MKLYSPKLVKHICIEKEIYKKLCYNLQITIHIVHSNNIDLYSI